MQKKTAIPILIILSLLLSSLFFFYMRNSMDAATIIRKLQGLRVSAQFFKNSAKRMPDNFDEVIEAKNLAGVPRIKLKWHFAGKKILLRDDFIIENTGTWVYVNNPKSSFFGTVFIDSSSKDEKGRYWSNF